MPYLHYIVEQPIKRFHCSLLISLKMRIRVIKTHGSELQGQEEAGLHDEPVSYLQVTPL